MEGIRNDIKGILSHFIIVNLADCDCSIIRFCILPGMIVGRRGDRDGVAIGVEVAVVVVVVAAEPVGSGEQVGLGVGVLAAVGRARVAAADVPAENIYISLIVKNVFRWRCYQKSRNFYSMIFGTI